VIFRGEESEFERLVALNSELFSRADYKLMDHSRMNHVTIAIRIFDLVFPYTFLLLSDDPF
jgi:hypothetical protein